MCMTIIHGIMSQRKDLSAMFPVVGGSQIEGSKVLLLNLSIKLVSILLADFLYAYTFLATHLPMIVQYTGSCLVNSTALFLTIHHQDQLSGMIMYGISIVAVEIEMSELTDNKELQVGCRFCRLHAISLVDNSTGESVVLDSKNSSDGHVLFMVNRSECAKLILFCQVILEDGMCFTSTPIVADPGMFSVHIHFLAVSKCIQCSTPKE